MARASARGKRKHTHDAVHRGRPSIPARMVLDGSSSSNHEKILSGCHDDGDARELGPFHGVSGRSSRDGRGDAGVQLHLGKRFVLDVQADLDVHVCSRGGMASASLGCGRFRLEGAPVRLARVPGPLLAAELYRGQIAKLPHDPTPGGVSLAMALRATVSSRPRAPRRCRRGCRRPSRQRPGGAGLEDPVDDPEEWVQDE